MIENSAFEEVLFSIAMTETLDDQLRMHLDKGPDQEDLTFALWRPSWGRTRLTAILQRLILPGSGDRLLHGNVAFTPDYIQRVLQLADDGCGIALLHSHLGPGWQGMSHDDIVAERDRLAAAVAGRTGLPLIGLTRGTDGAWSGRFWFRRSPVLLSMLAVGLQPFALLESSYVSPIILSCCRLQLHQSPKLQQ